MNGSNATVLSSARALRQLIAAASIAAVLVLCWPEALRAETPVAKPDLEQTLAEASSQQSESATAQGQRRSPAGMKALGVGSEVTQTSSLIGSITKGLLYTIGALLLGLAAFKKFRSPIETATSKIQVISRRALSPKSALFVISVEGQTLLIGSTEQQLSLITRLEPAADFDQSLRASFEDDAFTLDENPRVANHG
ncbi:MAG: flagellar biosynthetic protein FliO [Bdellovibrionales bacterium]|nr:flagellar biosynthetic protein FliO [Bdellovibrionales bacterium]